MGNGPSRRRLSSFWRWNLTIWAVLAVPLFFVRLSMHADPVRALGLTLFQETLAAILCGQLRTIYHRVMRRHGEFSVQSAAWVVFLSLAATGVQAVAVLGLVHVSGWRNPLWSPLEEWLLRFMFYWLVYMTCSLLYFWFQAEKDAREKSRLAAQSKAEAQRMELQLLRAQLDPHFLFNSLNGIATVIPAESDKAVSMVLELSDYLRYSLENRTNVIIPLAAEMDAMNAYLRIEKARFGEQMIIRTVADDDARRRPIPCFLLQPLVENAVKHSFQSCDPPWSIALQAEVIGESLHITVANTGRYTPDPYSPGFGLQILRRRLNIHYPRRHRFTLHQEGDTVLAELDLEGEPCSA